MTDPSDAMATRPISARVPTVIADQIELVQTRQGLRTLSDAVIHVLDKGLDAIAGERAKTERLEATVARIDDLVITVVAVLNLVHDLDPAAVAETKAAVHERLGHPRRPSPKVQVHDGFHPKASGTEGEA
ncbi:hypothetical protein HL658_30705 [Azospirillum sp. RWY-5-1]|uniref:NTP pyrophosphohydrolase MazG putative catalytic core domain-containing protein n=1 Tax=Azospirillum oleiclasticum TaxID=2735135 RepID=A0ABX2TFF3_9PROT|nr:hypothetical protein [Azospirillum oleiclasticum]NYZ16936.1 hypothetical protein [Azospirillum oleiclasticum]NYZ21873.1 hypothetical protein [Azospirillum oleiclasticum]